MSKSGLILIFFCLAGCGVGSSEANSAPPGGEAPFDAYRQYSSELIRLQRLPYAERDLSVLNSMVTQEWAALDEALLFEQPEAVEQSERDPELDIRLTEISEDSAVLSVCRTQWRDLLYVDTGDRIGGGDANRVGSVVTMRLVDSVWLVDSDLFDQRQCNRD